MPKYRVVARFEIESYSRKFVVQKISMFQWVDVNISTIGKAEFTTLALAKDAIEYFKEASVADKVVYTDGE